MAKAGVLFVGTTHGVEVWSDPGGSGRWRRRITALPDVCIDTLSVSDALQVQVTSDGRSFRSTDGGLSWEACTDGAAHPTPHVITLSGLPPTELRLKAQALERRSSPDDNWQPVLTAALTTLHAAPYHQDTVWAGDADGTLWLSTDRGRTWQPVGHAAAAVRVLGSSRLI